MGDYFTASVYESLHNELDKLTKEKKRLFEEMKLSILKYNELKKENAIIKKENEMLKEELNIYKEIHDRVMYTPQRLSSESRRR
jgi:hypothetical protein